MATQHGNTNTLPERLRGAGYEPIQDHGIMLVRSKTPFKPGDDYEGHPILGTLPPGSQVSNAEGEGPFVGVTYTHYAYTQRMLALPGVRRIHGWPLIDNYSKREGEGYKLVTVSHTSELLDPGWSRDAREGTKVRFIHLAPDKQGLYERVNLEGDFDKEGNPRDDIAGVIERALFDVNVGRVLDILNGN